MSTKFSALVTYFERIAAEHITIQHSATEKHFARFELDEVLSGLPAQMRYPALILEGYGFRFLDNKSDNPVKKRQGAFMLIDHVKDIGDYNLIHETWDSLESIGDDIIARIRTDRREPSSPVRDFDISSVEASLLATEFGNLYGIRFTFAIDSHFSTQKDSAKWRSFFFSMMWSNHVCATMSVVYQVAWSNHVCAQPSHEWHLSWSNHVCASPQYSWQAQWSSYVCVQSAVTFSMAWFNHLCQLTPAICYGYQYKMAALTDSRGIAPLGYHPATIWEWNNLIQTCGGYSIAGSKLRTSRIVPDHPAWVELNNGTDDFGFGLSATESSFGWGHYWAVNGNGEQYPKMYYTSAVAAILLDNNANPEIHNVARCVRDSLDGYVPGEKVIDRDGNVYNTKRIGQHVWTLENLAATRYRNGDPVGANMKPIPGLDSYVFQPKNPQIGSYFAGGIVFYILQPGDPGYNPAYCKGFSAAFGDLLPQAWGSTDTYVNQTSVLIGSGQNNTGRIQSVLGYLGYPYAASSCISYSDNGLTGWYLPSRDELYKLFLLKAVVPGIIQNGFYWSSSEYTENSSWKAWCVDFGTGTLLATYDKSNPFRVRPIRSFSLINNP